MRVKNKVENEVKQPHIELKTMHTLNIFGFYTPKNLYYILHFNRLNDDIYINNFSSTFEKPKFNIVHFGG